MKQRRLVAASLLTLSSAVYLLGQATTFAQSSSNTIPSGGLRITPAITEIKLQSHEKKLGLQYTLSNLTSTPLTIALGARDFGALSQSGSITLFGNDYNPATNPHGIQSYVTYTNQNVLVAANSSQQVTVSIKNTDKLAPGGHYGAILFSPQSAFSNTGNNRVNLNTSVAGLVFLTTAQGGTYGISASIAHISPIQFTLPSNAYLVFKNTGNTQTIPQGQLTLYNPRKQVLSTQVVNSASGLVLSGGSRIFQSALPPNATWHTLPGIYHFTLEYKDSQDARFKTIDQSFLYINWKVLLLTIAVLLVLIYVTKRFVIGWAATLIKLLARIRKPRLRNSKEAPISEPKVMDIVSPKRPKRKPPQK